MSHFNRCVGYLAPSFMYEVQCCSLLTIALWEVQIKRRNLAQQSAAQAEAEKRLSCVQGISYLVILSETVRRALCSSQGKFDSAAGTAEENHRIKSWNH